MRVEAVTKESRVTKKGNKYWGIKMDGEWYNCTQYLKIGTEVEGDITPLGTSKWFRPTKQTETQAPLPLPSADVFKEIISILKDIREEMRFYNTRPTTYQTGGVQPAAITGTSTIDKTPREMEPSPQQVKQEEAEDFIF